MSPRIRSVQKIPPRHEPVLDVRKAFAVAFALASIGWSIVLSAWLAAALNFDRLSEGTAILIGASGFLVVLLGVPLCLAFGALAFVLNRSFVRWIILMFALGPPVALLRILYGF